MTSSFGINLRSVFSVCLLAAALFSQSGPRATLAGERTGDPGAYLWKHVAIGAGGFITGYRSDRSGKTRVARADTYGAYIWHAGDGGRDIGRWSQLVTAASMPAPYRNPRSLNAGVYEIAVAPGDAARIYMVVKGRAFRSTDAGKTFTEISDDQHFPIEADANGPYRFYGPFIAVNPRNADQVFVGTPKSGLLRSDDGGGSWSKVETIPDPVDLNEKKDGVQAPGHSIVYADRPGRTEIYVSVPGKGLFVSQDQGRHFAVAGKGSNRPMVIKQAVLDRQGRLLAVDQTTRSVWRYDGRRWSDLTWGKDMKRDNFVSVAVDRESGRLFVFEAFKAIYASDDDGESWWALPSQVTISPGDPPWLAVTNISFPISQVAPDPLVANRFWAASGTGVYFADIDPEGAQIVNWVSLSRGIEQLVSNDVYQASGRAPLFAVWDFGIHRKPDLDAFSIKFAPIERMIISAQQVVGTPADPDFVVTNASDHRRCCVDGNTIMAGYSTDSGKTWTKFPTLPTPPGTDGRDPWRMSFGMIAVSSSDTNNIVWVPSYNRAPFFTKDRGRTWSRVRFPGERGDLTGSHADYYMPRRVLVADPVAGGTFYLVHSGNSHNRQLEGLWVTEDGGDHWKRVFNGEIAPASGFSAKLRAVPGRRGDLFFTSVVDGKIDTRLRRSKDGGRSWFTIDEAEHVDDIAFGRPFRDGGPPTIFISGQIKGHYGIWRSTDDGGSWDEIGHLPIGTLDQAIVMAGDPDVFGQVYIGYMGSGWIYGAPSPCMAKPYLSGDDVECFFIRR